MAKLKINLVDITESNSIYFKLSQDDIEKYFAWSELIKKCIKEKRPVPSKAFDKLMELFVPVISIKEKEFNDTLSNIKNEVLERFKNDKNYQFNHLDTNTKIQYSLENMIEQILTDMLEVQLLNGLEKDTCIGMSYDLIEKYKSKLSIKLKKFLPPYKLRAITGQITICMGYLITNRSSLTNEVIADSCRNAIKKYKQK